MLCLSPHLGISKFLILSWHFFIKVIIKTVIKQTQENRPGNPETIPLEIDRGEREYNKDLHNHDLAKKIIRKMTMHLFSVFQIP